MRKIIKDLAILFHYGAYTFIGYNIYEIYSRNNYSFDTTAVIAFSSRNYDSLPYRILDRSDVFYLIKCYDVPQIVCQSISECHDFI